MRFPKTSLLIAAAMLTCGASVLVAQLSAPFSVAHRHPAIDYWGRAAQDPVAELQRKVNAGETTLGFDGESGHLKSVLEALKLSLIHI